MLVLLPIMFLSAELILLPRNSNNDLPDMFGYCSPSLSEESFAKALRLGRVASINNKNNLFLIMITN